MKKLAIIPHIVLVLVLPLLLITSNLHWEINASSLYEYGFDKFNISQRTGLDRGELSKAAQGLIQYLNSNQEPIHVEVMRNGQPFDLFNQREKVHLADVKALVQLDYRVQYGLLAYVVAYLIVGWLWVGRRFAKYLARAVLWGSAVTLAVMLLIGVSMLLGFDNFFLAFHLVSFSNQFWILDPSKDYLIMMFPEGFFYLAAILLAVATAVEALLLGGTAWKVSGRYRS